MQSTIGFGFTPGATDEDPREIKQRKFAQELQDQIKARDEERIKEQIRRRGKLPSYLHDDMDELPKPSYAAKQAQNQQPAPQESISGLVAAMAAQKSEQPSVVTY